MNFTAQILFFLGALGVFNSLLLSFYFIFHRTSKRLSNIFFGFFLLFLSIRILKSLFYFFATEEPIPFLQTGPAIFIFIGPFLYLYIRASVRKDNASSKIWKLHIFLWVLIALGIYFIYPFKEYVTLNKNVILPLINIQWLIYILVSGYLLKPVIKKLFRKSQRISVFERWLSLLLMGTLILWAVYFFTSYNYFIAGSITFSALFYCFFLFFVFNKKIVLEIFKSERKNLINQLENDEIITLIEDLYSLMENQKLFKNPTLKSSEVALELGITIHQFSQLLNDNLGKNFSVFVNEYRVEEAKKLLFKNTKYTLEAVGNQAGFNSKTSFFNTFKKIAGTTPSKYQTKL